LSATILLQLKNDPNEDQQKWALKTLEAGGVEPVRLVDIPQVIHPITHPKFGQNVHNIPKS
jgi:hypothetical protein